VDGKPNVGPTLKGLYGKAERVKVAETTQMVTVDEAYLRQAILNPAEHILRGYPAAMSVIKIEPNELGEVVAYIKNLK
jgi:cytochrome c oxidase subunit 2